MRPRSILLPALLVLGACQAEEPKPDVPVHVFGTLRTFTEVTPAQGSVALAVFDMDAQKAREIWRHQAFTGLRDQQPVAFDFELPDRPAEHLFQRPRGHWAGLEVAPFVVGAFEDANHDGVPGKLELLVGTYPRVLAYVRPRGDDIQGAWMWLDDAEHGFRTGPEAGEMLHRGSNLIDLSANLVHEWPDALGARLADVERGPLQVDVFSVAGPADPALTTHEVLPGVAASRFVLHDPVRLPTRDHISGTLALHGGQAVADLCDYTVIAYHDRDGDQMWDFFADDVVGASHVAGEHSRIVRFTNPTNLAAGLLPDLGSGWSLVSWEEDHAGFTVPWDAGVVIDLRAGLGLGKPTLPERQDTPRVTGD